MAEILLIDVSHLFWSSWHAGADREIGFAYESTVEQVTRLAHNREHVAICIDSPPYFRKEISADYKAQRDKPEPVAIEQFRRVKDRLALDGYPMLAAPGYEADDIIAGVERWALDDSIDVDRVVIASNDKDLLQLVGARCVVLSTRSGDTMDTAAVRAKFGVNPTEMRDLLALMGDKSDNVPGVPGVGPKKAAALLAEFGDIDGILLALDNEPERVKLPSVRAAIEANREQLLLSRRLVTLRTDAPIDYEEIMQPRKPQPLTDVQDADFDEPNGFDDPAISDPPQPQEDDMGAAENQEEKPQEPPRAKPVTSLAKSQPEWALALEPSDPKSALAVAKYLHESRMFGTWKSAETILAVMLRGRALGIDSTAALTLFHDIKGKLAMHADLIVGLVLKSPKCEYFDCVETTSERATYETKRRGSKREVQITFTINDAHMATLVTKERDGTYKGISESGKPSNWDKYRATMLRHRAATQLARLVYPDVVSGLYDPEELEGAA